MSMAAGLLVWCLASIPVSLALGAVLGREREPERLALRVARKAPAPELRAS